MRKKATLPKKPPGKSVGQQIGPRTVAGELMDIRTAAERYGGSPHLWRARVARGVVPFRRWNSRILFLKHELDQFFSEELPGVSIEQAAANQRARDTA